MNERHAAGSVNGKFRVITFQPHLRYPHQQVAEFSSKADFRSVVVNPKVTVKTSDGGKTVGRGAWWLDEDGRREFDVIDFRPGMPEEFEVIDPHNGRKQRIVNTYSGFAVEPDYEDSENKCAHFLAHLRDNVAGGDEELFKYLLDWMASGVQHPENPGRSSLSIRGNPGTGKGAFALYYGGIFGRHFLHVTQRDQVTGKFNAHSAETCLIFVDKPLFAGNPADAQILKTLTSERTKMLERKGVDAIQINNYTRLAFATNEQHPIRIEYNDRRYCSVYVRDQWETEPPEVAAEKRRQYFQPLFEEIQKGGQAALLGFLLRRDISKFNPEKIPNTAERNTQKLLSAPATDKIIIEFAAEGPLPGVVSSAKPWLAMTAW